MRNTIEQSIGAGKVTEAMSLIERYIAAASADDNKSDISWGLRKRAQCLFMKGHTDDAVASVEEALAVARRGGDTAEEGDAENALGILYGERSNLVEAVRHLHRAYELQRSVGSKRLAATLNNLGNACLMMDDSDRALGYLHEAIAVARTDQSFRNVEATAHLNIGRAFLSLKQYDDAAQAFASGLDLFTELGAETFRAHALAKLASAKRAGGNFPEAETLYREALSIGKAREDPSWVHEIHADLGTLLVDLEKLDEAEPHLLSALESPDLPERLRDLPAVRRSYSVILERRGHLRDALTMMRSAYADLERANEEKAEGHLYRVMGKLELQRLDRENREVQARNDELTAALNEVERLKTELEERNAELSELVVRDPLTSLFNRRWFEARLATEVDRAKRYGRIVSVAIIDLDYFKRVNDTYGHTTGDRVLVGFAEAARRCLRSSDVVARYGGEEFAVLMPEADLAAAEVACEKLRRAWEATDWGWVGVAGAITLSAGIACVAREDSPTSVVERADRRLYLAKERGRNRVVGDE